MDKAKVSDIMRERIEKYNQFVMSHDINKIPVGLFCGKMGISIYFFHQARLYNNKKYEQFAKKLLGSIYSQLNTKSIISMEDGLIGICLGLNYLIDEKFLSGDINYMLDDLDDKIYQTASFKILNYFSTSDETIKNAFDVALYFSIRLSNKKLSKYNRFLYESIIIKAINQIESLFSYSDKLAEPDLYSLNDYFFPNFIYMLSLVQKLGFYNYKVNKIIDEISPRLLSTYPILHSNRLQLSGAMQQIINTKPIKQWEQHVQLLTRNIQFEWLIQNEFRNKNLLLANGLCGWFLIQSKLFKNECAYGAVLIDKIVKSEIWDDIYKDEIKLKASVGLFTGLGGVICVYQELEAKQNTLPKHENCMIEQFS